MHDIVKGVAATLIAAILLAIPTYIFVIKENQNQINSLTTKVNGLNEELKNANRSAVATKLFIASAHPDKDISSLAALKKIKNLGMNELDILAAGIISRNANHEIKAPVQSVKLNNIMSNYNITEDDLIIYGAKFKSIESIESNSDFMEAIQSNKAN